MKIKKKDLIVVSALFVLAVLFTILVKVIDVAAIGPNNSEVGFASINKFFWNLTGENLTMYKISEILGYLPILLALFYVGLGGFQLIKNKSFKKVDKNIYILGSFYVLVAIVYVLFELVALNYRPVLMDGVLEASYPSSHTLMAVCLCASSIIVNKKLFNKNIVLKIANIALIVLSAAIVVLRFISGVHWFTDILGGLIISALLLIVFYVAINIFNTNSLEKDTKTEIK